MIPAPVTAEVDYLLTRRGGQAAARAFLVDLASATYLVENLTPEEHGLALDTWDKYRDLEVGLADLSIVVLAHRLRTNRIMTFDRRHFDVLRSLRGGRFELLPAS